MKQIDKTIILILSKVIHTANFFGLSILFARILTKSDYGTYIQATMIINLLVLVLAFGIPPSLFYFLPKKNLKHRVFIIRSLLILLFIGLVASIVLIFCQDIIAGLLNNQDITKFLIYIGISTTFFMCANLTQPILLVANRSLTLATINLLKGIVFFSTMAICIFVNPKIDYLIYILTINYLLEFFILVFVIVKYTGDFEKSSDAALVTFKNQMKFSKSPVYLTITNTRIKNSNR
jgi:O-antigen/teichoic acid export membrane protein